MLHLKAVANATNRSSTPGGFEGAVTLSKRRREAGLVRATSSGRDDLVPRAHRRGA